jgi:phosphoribosylglycinamide formyltransferase-1
MFSIVILISGSGSNMQAIVRTAKAEQWQERFGAQIAAVISNKDDAKGLVWAAGQGIPTEVVDHATYASRALFDKALEASIDGYKPGLVVLAGFMRILGSDFVQHFQGRILNIHPSLLPAFTGLHTHKRAIAAGCRFAGATVHRVTPVLDEGEILAQAVVPVLNDDNESTLAARVLTQEHLIYPAAIRTLLKQQLLRSK